MWQLHTLHMSLSMQQVAADRFEGASLRYDGHRNAPLGLAS